MSRSSDPVISIADTRGSIDTPPDYENARMIAQFLDPGPTLARHVQRVADTGAYPAALEAVLSCGEASLLATRVSWAVKTRQRSEQ